MNHGIIFASLYKVIISSFAIRHFVLCTLYIFWFSYFSFISIFCCCRVNLYITLLLCKPFISIFSRAHSLQFTSLTMRIESITYAFFHCTPVLGLTNVIFTPSIQVQSFVCHHYINGIAFQMRNEESGKKVWTHEQNGKKKLPRCWSLLWKKKHNVSRAEQQWQWFVLHSFAISMNSKRMRVCNVHADLE